MSLRYGADLGRSRLVNNITSVHCTLLTLYITGRWSRQNGACVSSQSIADIAIVVVSIHNNAATTIVAVIVTIRVVGIVYAISTVYVGVVYRGESVAMGIRPVVEVDSRRCCLILLTGGCDLGRRWPRSEQILGNR